MALGLGSAKPVTAQQPSIAYTVNITGVPDEDLVGLLRETSQLIGLKDRPPATMSGLRRRTEEDVSRMIETLRSRGFYDASVTSEIGSGKSPVTVELNVEPGVLYLLSEFRIAYRDVTDRTGLIEDMEGLDLHAGMPAEGETVVAAQGRLVRKLAEQGHPRAKVLDRKVVVDHGDTTMSVDLAVDPGPLMSFGETDFEGLETVEESYLRDLIPWRAGQTYDRREVERLRDRLWQTDLFRTVAVSPADQAGDDGTLPITINVTEREHRTISAGLNFSSDRGLGGDISWEHRNFFGEQENLSVEMSYDSVEQGLTGDFRKPNFGRMDQTGLLNGSATRKDTDAYKERSAKSFIGVERKLSEFWTGRLGPTLEYAQINDTGEYENFLLLGLDGSLSRDTTDSPLDPTEGTRFSVSLTPSHGMLERDVSFLTGEVSGSAYYGVFEGDRVVFAGRFRLASLTGASTQDIPASKRLYAGGGGSVRGYEYESLGPLDADNDAVGGRSAVELGFETRFRVTDSVGVVPFLEGGNVFDDEVPEISDDLQWATGLGLRYFTPVGPLRLDLTVPIDRRAGVDDRFEFYVSLGQAF